MKKSFFIMAIVAMAIFANLNLKAQPPYDITELTYKNFEPNEIPLTETFWTYDLLGVFYENYIIDKFSNFCSVVFESQEYCEGGWSGWTEGVYNVKDPATDCKIRVEYRWRRCLTDHKIRQHEILNIFFKTANLWNTACNDLQDWLNNGGEFADIERVKLLFEDMYQKIALEAFLDDNALVQQEFGHPIYCSEENNVPTKIYHVNGSCQKFCYCTFHLGTNGETYTIISFDNCVDNFCCTIANTYCIDDITNKTNWTSNITYTTPGADSACAVSTGGDPGCLGETCYLTNCLFGCADEYCVKDYSNLKWSSYPYRDIYADILDPSYFPLIPPTINSINTKLCNDNSIINAYPNPTDNQLNIQFNINIDLIDGFAICNDLGETIYELNKNKTKGLNSIDLTGSPNGSYYIILKTNDIKYVKKFIISK